MNKLGSPDGVGVPPTPPALLTAVAGAAAELCLRGGEPAKAEAYLTPALAAARRHAHHLGLSDALEHPDLINLHSPMVPTLAKLLLRMGEALMAQGLTRYKHAVELLDEAASLCGHVTSATHAGVHARVALLRGHAHRALMNTLPGAGGDATHFPASEAALVSGIRWAASPEGAHERPLLRALLLELAALQVPDAMAEVAAVTAAPSDAAPVNGDTSNRRPQPALARLAFCLKQAARASKMHGVLMDASHVLTAGAAGVAWPAWAREAAAEEEAARDAGRPQDKLSGADASETRRVICSFVRLLGRIPAGGLFAPGCDAAFACAAELHAALLASDAYKSECCFPSAPVPSALKADDASQGATSQYVPEGGSGAVAAQWHFPPGAPPSFRGGGKPVVLVYFIALPSPPGRGGTGAETGTLGNDAQGTGTVLVGEVCFDTAEVRAVQHAIKAMRLRMTEAGEEGVPKVEALAVAASLSALLRGPPPAPPHTGTRSRLSSSRRQTPAPAPDETEVTEAATTDENEQVLDTAFFRNLEAFVTPEGGFCGTSAPLAAFLADALSLRS